MTLTYHVLRKGRFFAALATKEAAEAKRAALAAKYPGEKPWTVVGPINSSAQKDPPRTKPDVEPTMGDGGDPSVEGEPVVSHGDDAVVEGEAQVEDQETQGDNQPATDGPTVTP